MARGDFFKRPFTVFSFALGLLRHRRDAFSSLPTTRRTVCTRIRSCAQRRRRPPRDPSPVALARSRPDGNDARAHVPRPRTTRGFFFFFLARNYSPPHVSSPVVFGGTHRYFVRSDGQPVLFFIEKSALCLYGGLKNTRIQNIRGIHYNTNKRSILRLSL